MAYSLAPDWPAPRAIQHWPGIVGSALASKVPTAIAYDLDSNQDTAWGFCCEDKHDAHVEELFKLYLDPDYRDSNPNAPTHHEAQRWFTDYMRHLYRYLQSWFSRSFPRWDTRYVEFLFSVPTTWKNPAMIACLEMLIRDAGFGDRPSHTVHISLTEAEAAAVWVAKQNYEKDDVYLICDAGGGTTDVNILKIVSDRTIELEQLNSVEGAVIGSSLIDFKVQRLIETRLQCIQHLIRGEIDVVAEQMLRGRFDTFKCSFGSAAANLEKLPLAVPGLGPGQTFPQCAIEDGKMVITRSVVHSSRLVLGPCADGYFVKRGIATRV